MSARCFYCQAPATRLCDYRFGWPIGGFAADGSGQRYLTRAAAPPYTCDMPTCDQHAERRGGVHFRIGGRGHFDTIDHCPEHAGKPTAPSPAMREVEAEKLRLAVREQAARRLARDREANWTPPTPTVQGELF